MCGASAFPCFSPVSLLLLFFSLGALCSLAVEPLPTTKDLSSASATSYDSPRSTEGVTAASSGNSSSTDHPDDSNIEAIPDYVPTCSFKDQFPNSESDSYPSDSIPSDNDDSSDNPPNESMPDDGSSTNNTASDNSETSGGTKYLIGVGKADITGPVAQLPLAGYAHTSQVGNGLRQRLYSRCFIIGDVKYPQRRVVYCVLDNLVGETPIRLGLLEALKNSDDEYSVYGTHNVALAAVHSHATPGSWWNYFLPQVPGFGFDTQSYKAVVDGTLLSIKRAHQNLQEGYLDVGTTEITDAAINRSLFAYLNNPMEERAQYQSETDTTMTLLRLRRASDGKNVGFITWFPVHGTSLYSNNTHIAGDNKGLAAWMIERNMKNDSSAADGFVAAFSQANLGDATPNIEGAWCEDGSGKPCSFKSAACPNGKVTSCHARGPMFRALDEGVSSCFEIARRQAVAAEKLLVAMNSSSTPITGSVVKGFHFQNMAWWSFTLPNGTELETCPSALGYSFAAGTTDRPGLFNFIQGESNKPRNPLWKYFFGIVRPPTTRQKRCQVPKPILFDGGETNFPYAWEPNIVNVAMFRIGQFFIILSPSEVTTMSGRRWKAAVAKQASLYVKEPIIALASTVNAYAHYVATPEEYDIQRYEGASTIFGRNQLNGYINLGVSNMHYLASNGAGYPSQGPSPPDNRKKSLNLILGVFFDSHPFLRKYGDVLRQPNTKYKLGEVVQATFQGANPRNNLRLEDTYVAVEHFVSGNWTRVRDDSDWFLVFTWRSTSRVLQQSEVDVKWETGGNAEPCTYRFKYYGDSKTRRRGIESFEGTSEAFLLEK